MKAGIDFDASTSEIAYVDADGSEIKRAYFSAVKLHSPDSDPEGFKAARTAYETLSDPNKRTAYDAWFTEPDDIQNEILAAHELFRENKYKQAVEFLTELGGRNPDSAEVKRLLAEALFRIKKSGAADNVCRELLEKNPLDYDTLLLRAKITSSHGHTAKTEDCILEAIAVSPMNPKAWVMYMDYAMQHNDQFILSVFERAMKQSPDMFRDDYYFYLVGADLLEDIRGKNLFKDDNPLAYYNKFVDYFINDKNHDKAAYDSLVGTILNLSEKSEYVPFMEKALSAIENSRYGSNEDFKHIHTAITINKLRADERVHAILADLTEYFLYDDGDNNDRLGMECYIVFHLAGLRPSIKVLRDEYPECFELNQAFYIDVLTDRKTEYLTDKYMAVFKRLPPVETDEDDDYEGPFDKNGGDYEIEGLKPFVRETPKIGRNDPCPCGSGKKYKKCCG